MPGIAAMPFGDGYGQGRSLDAFNANDPAFRLRYDLLGDDNNVSSLNGRALACGGVHKLRAQVVSRLGFRHTLYSDHADFRWHNYLPMWDSEPV